MNCEECLPLIEEYVDGELRESLSERLAGHLATCSACASEVEELRREQALYAGYQREVEVTPAHWNMLRARIEQEKEAQAKESRPRHLEWFGGFLGLDKRFRPALILALLLIFVGITAVIIYNSRQQGGDEIAVQPQKQETARPPDSPHEEATPNKMNDDRQTAAKNEKENDPERPTFVSKAPGNPGEKRTVVVVNKAPSALRRKPIKSAPPANEPRFEEIAVKEGGIITNARWNGPVPAGDFDFEIARHAEKSELLLRSFRNVRPPAHNHALDLSYEREASRKLLYQNISLRRYAETRGDQSTAALLNTLEPILLDIAHLPAKAKERDIRPIEQRMRRKEIVAALQVRALVAAN